jgi:hypothetical protein
MRSVTDEPVIILFKKITEDWPEDFLLRKMSPDIRLNNRKTFLCIDRFMIEYFSTGGEGVFDTDSLLHDYHAKKINN